MLLGIVIERNPVEVGAVGSAPVTGVRGHR
jgi:hypothetical protein